LSLESLNALKPLFPLLQKAAISHILDHGDSVLDSPKANQSFSKVDKPLTKEQEEDKVVSNYFQPRTCQNLSENLPVWVFFEGWGCKQLYEISIFLNLSKLIKIYIL